MVTSSVPFFSFLDRDFGGQKVVGSTDEFTALGLMAPAISMEDPTGESYFFFLLLLSRASIRLIGKQ